MSRSACTPRTAALDSSGARPHQLAAVEALQRVVERREQRGERRQRRQRAARDRLLQRGELLQLRERACGPVDRRRVIDVLVGLIDEQRRAELVAVVVAHEQHRRQGEAFAGAAAQRAQRVVDYGVKIGAAQRRGGAAARIAVPPVEALVLGGEDGGARAGRRRRRHREEDRRGVNSHLESDATVGRRRSPRILLPSLGRDGRVAARRRARREAQRVSDCVGRGAPHRRAVVLKAQRERPGRK